MSAVTMANADKIDHEAKAAEATASVAKPDMFEPSESFLKRRRSRSIAIGVLLVAMVVLFYIVTIVKLGPGIMDRAL